MQVHARDNLSVDCVAGGRGESMFLPVVVDVVDVQTGRTGDAAEGATGAEHTDDLVPQEKVTGLLRPSLTGRIRRVRAFPVPIFGICAVEFPMAGIFRCPLFGVRDAPMIAPKPEGPTPLSVGGVRSAPLSLSLILLDSAFCFGGFHGARTSEVV